MNSMTGFGRSRKQEAGREMTVEVKSVNHRFLDISCRVPRSLNALEEVARSVISEQLTRGHVDVYVSYSNTREDAREVVLDVPLATAYKHAFQSMEQQLGLHGELSLNDFCQLPDVLKVVEKEDDQDAIQQLFIDALSEALIQLREMRAKEGHTLICDLLEKIGAIDRIRDQIAELAPQVVSAYRSKLRARLNDLLAGEIDEARFETEVAIFADRCAIDEELVRLRSHTEQIRLLLRQEAAVGRKLDFLVQELNREINTIGSKASDGEIARLVVEAKGEIEKIREQVQNLE